MHGLHTQVMFILAIDEFYNGGATTGDTSFHGVAGVHGLPASFNGQSPSRSGG